MFLKHISILLVIFSCTVAQAQDYFFRQYSKTEGLNHSFAYAVSQDDKDYLWIGTNEGAYRFDGFSFEYFSTEQGLADNFISTIFQDASGRLWFGHQSGSLTVLNQDGFKKIEGMPDGSGTIMDIVEDEWGSIWIVAQNSGLISIGLNEEMILWEAPSELSGLTQILITADHQLLLGTMDELYFGLIKPEKEQIELLNTCMNYPGSEVVEILPDDGSSYFILSRDEGIYMLSSEIRADSMFVVPIDDNMEGNLENAQGGVLDRHNRLWIITMGSGVYSYERDQSEGYMRTRSIQSRNGLVSENVRALFEDSEGNIWMGFYGEGIGRLVESDISFYTIDNDDEEPGIWTLYGDKDFLLTIGSEKIFRIGIPGGEPEAMLDLPDHHITDRVNSAIVSNDGSLWLGFDQAGLFRLNPGSKSFRKQLLSPDDLSNSVNHLATDGTRLWIGTKKGVCRLDIESGEKTWFTTKDGLPHNNIRQLFVDHQGRILVATLSGQVHYINGEGSVSVLENSQIGPLNSVIGYAEDLQKHLWIITQGNGLFQLKGDSVYNYTTASGLLSDYCYSISISSEDHPVIGHTGGISVVNPEKRTVKIYGELDGIPNSTEFYQNAIWSGPKEGICFGTSQGLISYGSGLAAGGNVPPRIHISSVKVDGDEIPLGQEEIILKPGQYELTVEYIGLNLSQPEAVLYQSQLEGFSRDWSQPSYRRAVVYDRVGHGSYSFQIRAYNQNEVKSEVEQAFALRIRKPFYLSVWFYTLALTLLAVGFFIILRIRERYFVLEQERLLKNLDEKSKEVIVKEEIIKERERVEKVLIEAKTKAEHSEKLKTSFLQNMSHEIRTPMNAIVGFTGLLNDPDLSDRDRKDYIENVSVNAKALLRLIDDILDLSKLETDQLSFNKKSCNLNRLFLDLEQQYMEVLKRESKVDLTLSLLIPDGEDVLITGDCERIKQVLEKLLDNAVKFTEKGDIRMGFSLTKSEVLFMVEDTGIGLSEDKKEIIFDLFRKIEDDQLKLYGGTGMGLTLARYLVNMMGGEIDLESHEGFGSKFFFTLPMVRSSGAESDEVEGSVHSEERKVYSGKRILVVEDTDSNFRLIKSILAHTGIRIKRALTGEEALQMFFADKDYDLVVMDMKLPGLDGYETTRMIRIKDSETPIISHTAYALEGDREKSLEVGCNDYLPKPTEKDTFLESISRYLG